jgi:hypothetical protein
MIDYEYNMILNNINNDYNIYGELLDIVIVNDKDSNNISIIYIYSIMDIIPSLVKGNINPKTNKKFSDETYSSLCDKYAKEIKMYSYFHQ